MALQDVTLPRDVPWTLLATSQDMLASKANPFPNAMWRSSVAIFKYDPTADDLPDSDEYVDRALTFLKVVVSVTGYTPDCAGCPGPPRVAESASMSYSASVVYQRWKEANARCQALVHQSYPCFGALIQCAVYPKDGSTDLTQLAYFAAFEPKKRELIEAATESGEAVTQSKSDMNVRKGVTSTQSTEDLDVFMGANLSVGAGGASVGAGISGQWGTIKKSGTQQEDITNTDSSRETREVSSHTTSLSQLYHLLNSYHLGTNRAIFFLQPRPHTLQQKDQFTFINGPQEIEGVQEFFLVVNRPIAKQITDYCVDALLYTGHLDIVAMQNAITEPKTAETPWIDLWAAAAPLPKPKPWWDPSQWVGDIEHLTKEMVDTLEAAVGIDPNTGELPDGITMIQPAVLDVYVPPQILNQPNDANSALIYNYLPPPTANDNGWRIDRTRGLGGYDLWEDPDNISADFRGNFDEGKTGKAQAFVDIVSSGTPDDLANYVPDYALRLRATAYPQPGEQATYHCRVKAYFIRNDLPTTQRAIDMFVAARGISTCTDSLFNDVEPTGNNVALIAPGSSPDLIADATVNPPSIAPWSTPIVSVSAPVAAPPQAANGGNNNPSASLPQAESTHSSTPSGLVHFAIGAARAKMANSVPLLVRTQLVASLRCLPDYRKQMRYRFVHTDFYFQTMLRTMLKAEILTLANQPKSDPGLDKAVIGHPLSQSILGTGSSIIKMLRSKFSPIEKSRLASSDRAMKKPTLASTKISIQQNTQFPILTLHSSRLAASKRRALLSAGISSGLDFVGVSAMEIAKRTQLKIEVIRDIRLQLLGITDGSSQ